MNENPQDKPFWERLSLQEMSNDQWESLCDGCGRCCLIKLEDEDTDIVHYTDVACSLLDCDSCKCRNYPKRQFFVPNCLSLDPKHIDELSWLPPSCAYSRVNEGRALSWWHPLISGSDDTVHEAGVSVRHKVVQEDDVPDEEYEDRLVTWPEDDVP
jgi:uncharacterized cysteine cluster protein YcgN (CxxCxxCC family)